MKRSEKDIERLKGKLAKVSHTLKKVCVLIEQDADPIEILSLTHRVHNALRSIQGALIESENQLCIEEVLKMKSAPSILRRLKEHRELLVRYGR